MFSISNLLSNHFSPTKRLFLQEAKAALEKTVRPDPDDKIQISDIEHLPASVKNYLIHSNVIGKERVHMVSMKMKGKFKMDRNMSWMPIEFFQYSFIEPSLTRLFFIKGLVNGFIPIVGRDKYENGKGMMLIRPLDLFTAGNIAGPHMDRGELVTFLNDMILFPMAMVSNRVKWEPHSDSSARAYLQDGETIVSAIFHFNSNNEVINFETDDRTFDNGKGEVRKATWRTPIQNYREAEGVKVPFHGDAIWDFGDEKFHYASINFTEIAYNKFKL